MRSLVVLSLAACAASALASFDMMLLANGIDNRIHRYDPANNVALGSFPVNGSITDIAVNQSANTVYTLLPSGSSTGIAKYNYNTGAYLGATLLAGSYGNARKVQYTSNGELLVSYERDVVRYNADTGAQIGVPLFYSDRRFIFHGGSAYLSNGNFVLAGESDGTAWNNDYLMTFTPTGTQTGSVMSSLHQSVHSYADIVSNQNSSALMVTEQSGGSSVTFTRYNVNGSAIAATNISLSIGGTSITALGSEWGHNNLAYCLFYNPGTQVTTCYQLDTTLNLIGSGTTISALSGSANAYRGSAMILAPEPSSMLAVLAGLGLLARRRRS
ncbi:MAG: PEP-CTERM sorting domain-containing protein [Chthonomonas sp.]|nr:PEP-CTERM sorting domain-containing protein [Chthonomonas sp.]